ncbi:MAG: hypothetical protein ABMA13_20130 [Chthoniobacteraceae bacterium]
MDIKAELAEIEKLMDCEVRAMTDQRKLVLMGKLMPLIAVAADETIEVPADVLEPLGNDGRKLAVAGFATVLLMSLQKD